MKHRAQVLLLVLFLLILSGMLVAGLGAMWRSEISMSSSGKDGLLAFYLAQSGIERAKAELRNNWDWPLGTSSFSASLGEGDYDLTISRPSADRRVIVSTGMVREAMREVSVSIDRSTTMPYTYTQTGWSWREI
jgi:hypothetical protein